MLPFFILFIIVSAVIAFSNWRLGILMMIAVGVLQDPVRKMTLGVPAIMVLCIVPVWISACLGVLSREGNPLTYFKRAYPGVHTTIVIFAASLIPASIMVFQYGFQAWKIAVLGIFGYLNPIAALLVGFLYARDVRDLLKLLVFYCILTSVAMTGTLLQYLEVYPDWSALGTQVLGTEWIRERTGYALSLTAGFYRGPDIMGWHAAALVVFGLTLALYRGGTRGWSWIAAVVWGSLCVLLSGRRKSIMIPPIWACAVAYTYLRAGRVRRVVGLVLLIGSAVAGFWFIAGEVSLHQDYVTYANMDAPEVSQRVQAHSWQAVLGTYRQSGFWGKGIGTASQGMQHLGLRIERSWQEGGLAKLMVELGVPGLACGIVLAVALARACYTVIRAAHPDHQPYRILVCLAAFLVANTCVFIVSHQIYNDPLIMTLTLFFVGVVLSGPRWCRARNAARGGSSRAPLRSIQ